MHDDVDERFLSTPAPAPATLYERHCKHITGVGYEWGGVPRGVRGQHEFAETRGKEMNTLNFPLEEIKAHTSTNRLLFGVTILVVFVGINILGVGLRKIEARSGQVPARVVWDGQRQGDEG